MMHIQCSTPGCPCQVPAESRTHRIVLHDAGTHVLGILYYCSSCLEHFAAYGAYSHFAPRYNPPSITSRQSLAGWNAWVDEWLDEGI
jgi:hypothetical protein